MKINISQITTATNQVRTVQNEDDMTELISSIKQQGLLSPIKVRPQGDSYQVVFGHRRLEACKRLGWSEIECVIEGIDDQRAEAQALIENLIRSDMTDHDTAKAIRTMKDQHKLTNAEVGQMIGWSESKVRGYLAMLSGEVGKVLEAQHVALPYSFVTEAKAGAKDDQLTAKVIQKAIDEGLTRNQTRKVADAIGNAESPEERQAILDTPIDNPMFDRIVRAKAKAETEHKAVEAERHLGNTQEVKPYLDAVKAFEKAIDEAIISIEFNKFSPEAKQYTLNRNEKLIGKINQLNASLTAGKPQ